MINLFKRKTSAKDIALLELKIADLIIPELPKIKENLTKGKLKIYFSKTGILLSKEPCKKTQEIIKKNKHSFFELSGIYLVEKKTQKEKEIKLFYQYDALNQIEIDCPETFYKDYDLNSITKKDLTIRNIEFENPDLKTVSKILSSLNKEQLELLDLESTFEIEIDQKFYYPILDFENGNYIAVDKKGKIYRLNHDNEQDIKEIFKNVHEFLEVYKGIKSDLEIYFE